MDSTYLPIARLDDLVDDAPAHAAADGIDLVLVRRGGHVHVFEGRCLHRGALLADGRVEGDNLICGVHGWDYRIDTGVSAYNPAERIYKFACHVLDGEVLVDEADLVEYRSMRPERAVTSTYDRLFDDPHQDTVEEPFVSEIHELARNGLSGMHGPVAAMGVPRAGAADVGRPPVRDRAAAPLPAARRRAGRHRRDHRARAPRAAAPRIPLFVSDMSFGALSPEAKTALARGAERAGTGDLLGRGRHAARGAGRELPLPLRAGLGPLRLAHEACLDRVQAFHFKLGQGAKTGTGGHLPGAKVVGRIAEVRGLPEGTPAVSPARFPDWTTRSTTPRGRRPDPVRELAAASRSGSRCRPSTSRPTSTPRWTLGVDYVILDGRGGGTGAAPLIFRDHISVPTIPALARARRHLDRRARATSRWSRPAGCRRAPDFAKALALGRRRDRDLQLGDPGDRLRRACGRATPTTARSASPPRSRTCGPGCRSHEAAERLDRFLDGDRPS